MRVKACRRKGTRGRTWMGPMGQMRLMGILNYLKPGSTVKFRTVNFGPGSKRSSYRLLEAAKSHCHLSSGSVLALVVNPEKKSATEVAPGSDVPLARSPSVFARPNFGSNSAVLSAPFAAEVAA
jgi:hypothetical protein